MTEAPMPPLPDSCFPVDVSCVPDWDDWEIEPDPEADPPVVGVPKYTDADKDRAVALAGETMRFLTAYRVGGCPIVVRPCKASCTEATWRTYPVGGGGNTGWGPVNLGGTWLNIGCGHTGACGCTGIQQIRLYGTAGTVQTVLVDGTELDPSAYRLDPGGWLVRTDGDPWPLCQDLNLPDTEPGTWSVTYTPGAPVDGIGAWAAGILAGEYVTACATGKCRLPDTVTQIARQGVTMTLTPGAFPNGLTGIREVDTYVQRWNPHGVRGPSTVWSPDISMPRVMGVGGGYVPFPPDTIDGGTP